MEEKHWVTRKQKFNEGEAQSYQPITDCDMIHTTHHNQ